MWFDLQQSELADYRTAAVAPEDLAEFWTGQLQLADDASVPTRLEPYKPALFDNVQIFDVTFSGAHGHPIRGWFIRPNVAGAKRIPVIVKFIGYGGGRGMPEDHLLWPSVGYAVLVMDSRGQAGRDMGATGDPMTVAEAGPQVAGVLTRGLSAPQSYYYTRMWTDAARAVDVAAELAGIDPARVGVTGSSQGGALSIAAAALNPKVAWLSPEVPFMCDVARAITITDAPPYSEIAEYLAWHTDEVESARRTLSYVDCAVLARRITAPSLTAVGLMDTVCPPSTVYAAHNAMQGEKQIMAYEFMGHQPAPLFTPIQIEHARRHLG